MSSLDDEDEDEDEDDDDDDENEKVDVERGQQEVEEEEEGGGKEGMFGSDPPAAADPVLEAVTREDATRSASSLHPTKLFRFFC